MIEIRVNGSTVSVQETQLLYSGSAGTHICHFTFDEDWDRFSKSAVFRTGGRAVTAFLDGESCCTLPWELLTRANIGFAIEVGVYGVSAAAEVLTSVWDSIGTVRDGSEIGNDAREPGEGVYDQIMAGIQSVDEKVGSYNEQAQENAAEAFRSAEGAAAAATDAENAKIAAQSALAGVQKALDDLPAGDTLIINDLTTGGAGAALSAEMGKVLSLRTNPNLLHNWYFANAVNQRGEAVYPSGAKVYTIDRWYKNSSVAVAANDGCITITNTGTSSSSFIQPLANIPPGGAQLTFSALTADGVLYSGTKQIPVAQARYNTFFTTEEGVPCRIYSSGDDGSRARVLFYLPGGSSLDLVAVKLEVGSVQTLAHQDSDGKWVLNDIPDYNEELRKCQAYFQVVNGQRTGGAHLLDAYGKESGNAVGTLFLPVPMRAVPSVSFSGVAPQVLLSGDELLSFTSISGIEVSGDNCDTARLRLKVAVDDPEYGFEAGKLYEVNAASSGNVGQATAIYLDANL